MTQPSAASGGRRSSSPPNLVVTTPLRPDVADAPGERSSPPPLLNEASIPHRSPQPDARRQALLARGKAARDRAAHIALQKKRQPHRVAFAPVETSPERGPRVDDPMANALSYAPYPILERRSASSDGSLKSHPLPQSDSPQPGPSFDLPAVIADSPRSPDTATYTSPASDYSTYTSPASDYSTYTSPASDYSTYTSPAADTSTYTSSAADTSSQSYG